MLSKRGKSLKGVTRFQGVTLWLLRDKESPLGGSNMCEDNIFLTCVSKSVNDTFGGFFFVRIKKEKCISTIYYGIIGWFSGQMCHILPTYVLANGKLVFLKLS